MSLTNPATYLLSFPVTSPFGFRPQFGDFHTGIDLGIAMWRPLPALRDGVIVLDDDDGLYDPAILATYAGISVRLRADDGEEWWYAHLSENLVTAGQSVRLGDIIGYCGSTGASTGPHLHLERIIAGVAIDPLGRLKELGDYISRPEFEAYQQNVKETLDAIKAAYDPIASKYYTHSHDTTAPKPI